MFHYCGIYSAINLSNQLSVGENFISLCFKLENKFLYHIDIRFLISELGPLLTPLIKHFNWIILFHTKIPWNISDFWNILFCSWNIPSREVFF